MRAAIPFLPAALVAVAVLESGGVTRPTVALLAAVAALAVALAASVAAAPPPPAVVLALIGLLGLTLVSALWGSPGAALRAAPLLVLYAAAAYGAAWCARTGSLLPPLRVVLVAVAAAALADRALHPGARAARLTWPIGYADALGLVCAYAVLLCAAVRPVRPFWGLVATAATVLTASRSAVGALLLGLAVVAAARSAAARRALVVAVPAAAVALALAGPWLVHRFDRPQPDARNVSRLATLSGHGRTALWRDALAEGEAHPVLGGGAGTWHAYAVRRSGDPHRPRNAHSLELETFAELGVVGLIVLAGVLATLLVPAARAWREEPAVLALVAAWLAVSTVDWDWQIPAATLPVLIAAASVDRFSRSSR
jgi:hypothetical protein